MKNRQQPPSGGFLLPEVIMDKHTLLSIGIGLVLGFMFVLVVEHFRFVVGMVLCVLALRWLFSQW